ncbi:MAG: 3-keto-disaccharide hydrolase [Akkermansiaceae bacterium]
MKKTLTLITLAALVSIGYAKDKADDAKVINLFDGKTLNGWKIVGGNGKYKVEDGCIVGYGKNVKGNTFLRTEKTYGDFELTYEFKFDDRTGNSGLMFRALQKPSDDGNGRVHGYQCEGDNGDRSWTAGLYDEARRGWLFPKKSDKDHCKKFTAQGTKLFKWKEWNTIVIRCQGNHIQTWLNGEKRVDFKDTDPKHDTREGFFGLQVHGGKSCNVRWRNLKLKQL